MAKGSHVVWGTFPLRNCSTCGARVRIADWHTAGATIDSQGKATYYLLCGACMGVADDPERRKAKRLAELRRQLEQVEAELAMRRQAPPYRCPYCGRPSRSARACSAHSDVAPLDPIQVVAA